MMRLPSSPSGAALPNIIAARPPAGADPRGACRDQLGRSDHRPGHDAHMWRRSFGQRLDRPVRDVGSFRSVALQDGGARFDAHPFGAQGMSRRNRTAGSSAAQLPARARVHDARDHAGRRHADRHATVRIGPTAPPDAKPHGQAGRGPHHVPVCGLRAPPRPVEPEGGRVTGPHPDSTRS